MIFVVWIQLQKRGLNFQASFFTHTLATSGCTTIAFAVVAIASRAVTRAAIIAMTGVGWFVCCFAIACVARTGSVLIFHDV